MPGSFRLFRIGGISIEVNVSWLIILALLTTSLALDWFPLAARGYSAATYWILALVAALLFFASVLAHELAHSLVARARGLPVTSITLFIFGGVSNIEREPQRPGAEFWIAFVGPLTSLIIGGLALLAGGLIGAASPLLAALLDYLGVTNLLLAVFNLIPGFPLDGGRVLRSIIWKATSSPRTATLWAARVGQVFAFLLILVGVWQFFSGALINGLWFGFIGWFLLTAAQSENTQVALDTIFAGVTVGQLMSASPQEAPDTTTIQQLVDGYLLPQRARALPVMSSGTLAGLITLDDVRRVPRERWGETTARDAMTPLGQLEVARPNDRASEALSRMARRDVNQLPVLDGAGRLVGMLSRDTLMRYVEVRRGLGLETADRSASATRSEPQRPPTGEPPLPATS
jgi:Zn-dependent protease/CBS domain-containing protein